MARGWESKSVESQMDEAAERRTAAARTPLSDAQIWLRRERESLELSRTRVLKDLEGATNPRYRRQLEAALGFLEKRLSELPP